MKTRHDLFKLFLSESQLHAHTAQAIFSSMTDEELAKIYGLKVIRRGYYV